MTWHQIVGHRGRLKDPGASGPKRLEPYYYLHNSLVSISYLIGSHHHVPEGLGVFPVP